MHWLNQGTRILVKFWCKCLQIETNENVTETFYLWQHKNTPGWELSVGWQAPSIILLCCGQGFTKHWHCTVLNLTGMFLPFILSVCFKKQRLQLICLLLWIWLCIDRCKMPRFLSQMSHTSNQKWRSRVGSLTQQVGSLTQFEHCAPKLSHNDHSSVLPWLNDHLHKKFYFDAE